jgi:hypothetical protein
MELRSKAGVLCVQGFLVLSDAVAIERGHYVDRSGGYGEGQNGHVTSNFVMGVDVYH